MCQVSSSSWTSPTSSPLYMYRAKSPCLCLESSLWWNLVWYNTLGGLEEQWCGLWLNAAKAFSPGWVLAPCLPTSAISVTSRGRWWSADQLTRTALHVVWVWSLLCPACGCCCLLWSPCWLSTDLRHSRMWPCRLDLLWPLINCCLLWLKHRMVLFFFSILCFSEQLFDVCRSVFPGVCGNHHGRVRH